MKFGGIFNKKGSDKNGFKEDLAVSDPGSDDSWNALYNKVPEKNSIQGPSEAALPQSNPTEGFAATPSTVNTSPVGNCTKEKGGRKSADKNTLKNTDAHTSFTKISTCKKSKQCNSRSLIPVTSTPFMSVKRIPSFKVSPIISTVNGTNNDGFQEGTSPFADSTASLVVKRNNPTKDVDAFDQLLDPSKKKFENTTGIFPGIVPLQSVVNQADTTRQYAGGIIRGTKTFQDQFTDYAYNDSQSSLKEKSTEKVNSFTKPVNCRSRGTRKSHGTYTGTTPAQNEKKCEQVVQICKKSVLEHPSQDSGHPSKKTSVRRSTRGLISQEVVQKSVQEDNRSLHGRLQKNNVSPLNVTTVPKVPEINSKTPLEQPAPPKTSKQVVEIDPGSPAKESSCLRIDQKSESGVSNCLKVDDQSLKRTELIERQPIQGDGERNCLAKSRKEVNDCIEQPNEECHSPTEEGSASAKMPGGNKLCFRSAYEIHIGNNCLKQANVFSFAFPQNHEDQSDQASPKRIESVERDQLGGGEGCKRVQEEPIKNVSQVEDNRNINPSEDVCHQDVESQRPSLISESNTLEPSVKKIETSKISHKSGVGCSPSTPILPSTIEILNKPSPEGETCASLVPEKTNIVIETPPDTAENSNGGVSSSEEERILLRAQSLKLRENQSNSSRVTKSPKIIDTAPLGGNSKVLGRKLRFSVPLQSPVKNSEAFGTNSKATQKGILSHQIRFDKSLNQEHEYIPPDNRAPNTLSDSSLEVGVFLSRNPFEMQKTFDDDFELEIMSSSEEENQRSKKKKKHGTLRKMSSSEDENKQSKMLKTDGNLQNVQKTTRFHKGSNLSSRVKEIRRRKEAQIEALRNSKGDDSDSDPFAEKDGSVKTQSSKPGSGNKSSENKRLHNFKGHVRHMKTSTEKTKRERKISPMNARICVENIHETPVFDDIGLFNEDLKKDSQTEEDQCLQTGSQNKSETKQLKNSDIRTDRKNRAMKIQGNKQPSRRKTDERYTHLSVPSNDNEQQVTEPRYSQRVRKPPSMYWLGKKSRNTDNDFEGLVKSKQYNPTQSPALFDDDENERRKSKSQKRKVSKSSKPNILKALKKMKSAESENPSQNLESCPSSDLKNVLISSVKQDLSCSVNEMQEFRCVQGSGLKGDMLALGVAAKYEKVFHNHNQVFYVLEGDISYECSNDKTTLSPGSFFIVPHDTQYIITNMSNSTAKLVVVTCKM
ncbi:uncharacterized protein LOC113210690 isoform X1 [Frankliniella occidentalis]|uniref:Uncharacterized protein LOC113210690 isoform X1 n=1 Tax=Frankliniella occidentalis TaxID=133901 RepID=A0A6J1SUN1_FRAOC|nr:uncharacterized protein LOC113210690 isoform X1 [Frankliniella occidentalis]